MPTWNEKNMKGQDISTKMVNVALPMSRFIFSEGGNFVEKTTRELFAGKRVVIFGVLGAFAPICSTSQVPDYEKFYDELIDAGVDEVYCLSMNDTFVMNAWRENLGIKKVKFLPDGNGFFTRQLGKNVFKSNLGFGIRSWRYSAVIDSKDSVEVIFSEEGQNDNCETDPYENSKPEKILQYLKDVPRRLDQIEGDHDILSDLERIERDLFLR